MSSIATKAFRQWDIFMFPFFKERRHPAVIISNDESCQNADIAEINVLICTSAQVNRGPRTAEEVLDQADGLDWKTMVRCDRIYLVDKSLFQEKKGVVTPDRRYFISRKLIETLRLPLHRP